MIRDIADANPRQQEWSCTVGVAPRVARIIRRTVALAQAAF
ncbi:MAG TPA: hypothetical protein VLT89_16030 [Usitatibacter sp.]|nr:hypothetical protein [Usitatibacter sp.]